MQSRTMAVHLRIVKPLDRKWEDVGPRMRDLARLAHRVLNRTMTALALAAEHPGSAPADWKSRVNERSDKRPGGKLGAYPMAACAIHDANQERLQTRRCSWCKGTGVEPEPDPKPRKRSKNQPVREPGEACSKCDNGPKREYVIGEVVEVPSAIQAGWARLADRRFREDRKDHLAGRKALASFRGPAPIAVTSSGEAFRVRHDGRGYVLDVPLYPGGSEGCVPFAVAPDGAGAWAHVRRLLEPASKIGDLRILPPKGTGKRAKKWVAVITYTAQFEPEQAKTGEALTLKLGDRGVELWGSPLKKPRVLRGTETIRRQRAQFAARRASRAQHQRDIGRGARGHGRTRALEHFHAVDDAEQRWMRSVSQEIAAKAARTCKERGASWVTIDQSLAKVIPPARMREALEWALKKAGIAQPKKLSEGSNPAGEGGA